MKLLVLSSSLAFFILSSGLSFAQDNTPPKTTTSIPQVQQELISSSLHKHAKNSIDKGIRFLRQQQAEDGSYGSHVGLTAMTILAMAESPRKYTLGDGPFIRKAAESTVIHIPTEVLSVVTAVLATVRL